MTKKIHLFVLGLVFNCIFERRFSMKKIFVMFVLIIGIAGYVSENAYAGVLDKAAKTVVIHGPDTANLAFEPTMENAVGMVGDGIGSYVGGTGGAYVGAAVGTRICPGIGTGIGVILGYWSGVFVGGHIGEKSARKIYRQFK
jgi:hypothetical protein